MMTALYNGVSGIKTNSIGIDVTGNNIANANTVGFKNSQAEFKDLFYQRAAAMSQNPVTSSLGLGTTMAATALDMRGGSFQGTDNAFDYAIGGDGYFAVQKGESTYYTRAGQFLLDVNRDMVNTSGFYLMGTTAALNQASYSAAALKKLGSQDTQALTLEPTSNLEFSQTINKITLPTNLYIPPEPTTSVKFRGNLTTKQEYLQQDIELNMMSAELSVSEDGKANLKGTLTDTPQLEKYTAGTLVNITFANEAGNMLKAQARIQDNGSYELNDFDVSTLADEGGGYESLQVSAIAQGLVAQPSTAKFVAGLHGASGFENTLTINLKRELPNLPEGANWLMDASITDPNGNVLSQASSVLSFNGFGALTGNTLGPLSNEGAAVNIDFGSLYNPDVPNSGFDGIVMSERASSIDSQQKNGHADGLFKAYATSEDGTILAVFDNGMQAAVARVPLFHFQNDQGLFSESGVYFSPTANSGKAFMYAKEDGRLYNGSVIKSHMLENSNVDLNREMTMLIVQQRAYEASAKSISTSDQMLQRAINMKNG
ncbi:MAG: flagellar hook-basal body complex protein, partial [Campylobacter sp.]|uniref:flagellar hook-basal body complex protein n=1 Tax=Campylobacter sp. TaxID=205 RepID=UPI002AA8ABE7